MLLLNLIKCWMFCARNVYHSDTLATSIDYLLCFCPFFIWWGIKIHSVMELLSLPKEWFCFLITGVLLVFTWCSLQLFKRYCHFQIVYICVTNTSDFLIVSTKAHCHQFNVNRNPQSGVYCGKKRSSIQINNLQTREIQAPGGNQKCTTLRKKGGPLT